MVEHTFHQFAQYLTPEQAYEKNRGSRPEMSLDEWKKLARDHSTCQCGLPVWRYAGCGLCFSCTTGEADASEDYELVYTP